jgi:hypothetical protein
MTVTYDVRLFGEVADRYLPVNLGRRSSIARRVVVRESDPEFKLIARAVEEAEVRDGEKLVAGWRVRRRYTDEEMRASRLVLLRIDAVIEPSGEECGTVYLEASACRHCGAGAVQDGALFLRQRGLRRGRDVQRTLGGEVVVSRRVVDLMTKHGVSPDLFGEVYIAKRAIELSASYSQILTSQERVAASSHTRFGEHPFDDRREGVCPAGDTAGLNILSELTVVSGADIRAAGLMHTDRFVGNRLGLLRPERMIVMSQDLYRELLSAGVTGCSFERVHESTA